MTLIRDPSLGAGAVSVACYLCGNTHRLNRMWIDPDGPAFLAYYCEKCVEERESLVTTPTEGETR